MATNAKAQLLEAMYNVFEPEHAWLQNICALAPRAFGIRVGGVIAVLMDATRDDWLQMLDLTFDGVPEALALGLFNSGVFRPGMAGSKEIVLLFRRAWLGSLLSVFQHVPGLVARYSELLLEFGLSDIFAVNATEPTHLGCVLCFPGGAKRLDRATERSWWRFRAHLAAALRLRRALHGLTSTGAIERADAAITLTGQIDEVSGASRSPGSRAALRAALQRIDLARTRKGGDGDTLDLWPALVAGRWSLVEHFEASGRRYYLAFKNDPELVADHRLTRREQQALACAAEGHSDKLIACSLGLSVSTVATLLTRARRKLGVGSAARLPFGLGAIALRGSVNG